jgi:hypothetical protein
MRFKLSTFLIMAAVAPILIAAICYMAGCNNLANQTDQVIRSKLTKLTPRGTTAVDAIAQILASVQYDSGSAADADFLIAHEAATGTRAPLTPTDDRNIEHIVGSRSAGFMLKEIVIATWLFDDQDRVTEISIARRTYGP